VTHTTQSIADIFRRAVQSHRPDDTYTHPVPPDLILTTFRNTYITKCI
jgi:hypothetical protein